MRAFGLLLQFRVEFFHGENRPQARAGDNAILAPGRCGAAGGAAAKILLPIARFLRRFSALLAMPTAHWLVKQEPEDYAWTDFVRDGKTAWTGVRNYAARLHLRAMAKGDTVFFYHSGDDKAVVGLAEVLRPQYPDPTADEAGWVAVDLKPVKPLPSPVTLTAIKADAAFKDFALVRQSRLSVMPVSAAEAARLRKLGGL